MKVRTHTFRNGKYTFDMLDGKLLGLCDMPEGKKKHLYMYIPAANTKQALEVTVHEMMHAEKIPDKYLDVPGDDSGQRIGAALWRLGWRRTERAT